MSNETKHTPGPWFAVGRKKVDTGLGYTGDMIAITTDKEDPHDCSVAGIWNPSDKCIANAHLIAAAPELLMTLQYIVAAEPPNYESLKALCEKAIAKAVAK